MDNIEKDIAQGYADFADDEGSIEEVEAEENIVTENSTSFSFEENTNFSEMSDINRKLRTYFDGKIVRKDLTKSIKEGANVPVYVLEFLLGQYCSSDDPSIIEEGVANVKRILADNYVRPDEAQKILSLLRQRGSHTVIDKITVNLNIKKDTYEAEFSNLGIKAIPISEDYPSKFDRLLCGGIWCIVQLEYEYIKEQLKKLGGMEFYDVNFSYIDNETFEEFYVSVPEQGGGKLIPEGMCNPGQVYTVAQGKTGMLGVFRLESQMMPGNGKFERSGLGSDGKCKEATNTAFNFLKANSNRISGSISTTTKDYIINYQDLQGIGMTDKLALPTLIALSSVALGKPVASSLAVLGEISIAGTLIKVDELANSLQVCLDSGAKKVLLPIVSAADIGAVPSDLIGCFNLIFYSSAEDAVYKALGVE